ncbi:MAG: ATP-binding cassette domain-containing protein [Verrucomicrobiota bacterium]
MSPESPSPNKGVPVIKMRAVGAASLSDPEKIQVSGVDWTVAQGDFWVLGGPQGSGKSDFLGMIGGLTAPAGGDYYFLGEAMPIFDEERLAQRLKLGLVFDGGRLFNHLTVFENVALPLRYHHNLGPGEAEPEVRRMLELTGLTSWADSTPGAMPRNWQQRAGLARALMLRPEVLLLDNPLTGLDLRHRAWWLEFLGQLWRGHPSLGGKPATLIATADDLRPWRNLARHFAVLSGGRFRTLGSWAQAEAVDDPAVHELVAMSPVTVGAGGQIESNKPDQN